MYSYIGTFLFFLAMVDISWRWLYEIAVAEIDPAKKTECSKLRKKQHTVESSRGARESDIQSDLLAMRDASSNLRTLKQEWKQSSVRELKNHN